MKIFRNFRNSVKFCEIRAMGSRFTTTVRECLNYICNNLVHTFLSRPIFFPKLVPTELWFRPPFGTELLSSQLSSGDNKHRFRKLTISPKQQRVWNICRSTVAREQAMWMLLSSKIARCLESTNGRTKLWNYERLSHFLFWRRFVTLRVLPNAWISTSQFPPNYCEK